MSRKFVVVGFGNIGQAVIPLLRERFPDWRGVVIDKQGDRERTSLAERLGVAFIECCVTEANFVRVLQPLVGQGDILLNLAHAVSSCALIRLTQDLGAFYADTGIEPWNYVFESESETSNFALREEVLSLKHESAGRCTALVAHGANPGFVSVLVKRALLDMQCVLFPERAGASPPVTRADWAHLAAMLDVRVIQISERDTQRAVREHAGNVFVNTWSVDGFVAECRQEAEIGWGTHERRLPHGAHAYRTGCRAAIQLATSGQETIVKTWTPMHGEFPACVLTHNESISIADYLTLGERDAPAYRPTVYYAYRPVDAALDSLARMREGVVIGAQRVLKDELDEGVDELGVLLMSGSGTSLWLGSALSIERARRLAPLNNATSLQVVSSVVGGVEWMLDHPREGVVESDELDHTALFDSVAYYWEPIQRRYTNWRPDPMKRELTFDEFVQADALPDLLAAREILAPISA